MAFFLCCFGAVAVVIFFVEFAIMSPRDRRLASMDTAQLVRELMEKES